MRKPLVIGIALATGTLAVLGANLATASHSGSGSILTSSNNSRTIARTSGGSLTAPEDVNDASWSPDGCRAVFTSDAGDVATLRYNDGSNEWWVADFKPGIQRSHPTWRGTGSSVVWAEKPASDQPWQLQFTSSSYGWGTEQISPDDGRNYTHPDAGPGQLVVFQRQDDSGTGSPTGTPGIWLYDPAAGDTPEERISLVVSDGRNPALSPDGSKVAFVRSNQIFIVNIDGNNQAQRTTDGHTHDNPVWSPNGQTIAFSTGSSIATMPAAGGSETTVTGLTGKPAYEPGNSNRVVRLFGSDRFGTAIATSRSHWATAGASGDSRVPAAAVVLSRSDTFADALSGSALAAAKQGPLLMTPPTSLNAATKAEIARVLGTSAPATKTVYLLGSVGALSTAVENGIKAMGYAVKRLQGSDRFGTSIAIAKEIDTTPDLVLAATGMNFPDALAAGAAAGSYSVPGTGLSAVVILTTDTKLSTTTKAYLDSVTSNPDLLLFGIGSQAATAITPYVSKLGSDQVVPVFGSDRYLTALFTGQTFFGGEHVAGVATGTNWPDALAGGALMATLNGPVLLTPSTSATLHLTAEFLLDVECGSISTGYIFGSSGVVSASIDNQIGAWISGPAGFTKTSNPTTLAASGTIATASMSGGVAAVTVERRTPDELKVAAARIARQR
jgi:Tol biopolymer transport system component